MIAHENVLNVTFGLRRLLKAEKYHTEKEFTIPLTELTEDKEPQIRTQIAAIAQQIAADPSLILDQTYTAEERSRAWKNLAKLPVFTEDDEVAKLTTNMRAGHAILDHHMPHFWDVRDHTGKSVRSCVTAPILEKALWQNLRNHSTPYSSEIRREIINTQGLASVTKYRAPVAKAIVTIFGAKHVFDPCAGWGGRMLGTLAADDDTTYTGCEPDPATAAGLRAILSDPAIPASRRSAARILELPAESALPTLVAEKFDMILTSPPYFNLELYNGDAQSTAQYPTWSSWVDNWLRPVIHTALARLREGGVSCWSVKNFKSDRNYPLADTVKSIHEETGFVLVRTVLMTGCGRQGVNRIDAEGKPTRRSEEATYCFQRGTVSSPTAEAPPSYATMSKAALQDIWRQRGWKGFSTKSKEELVERLENSTT